MSRALGFWTCADKIRAIGTASELDELEQTLGDFVGISYRNCIGAQKNANTLGQL